MKTIWISMHVDCTFYQQVTVEDDVYEKLMKEADGEDLTDYDKNCKPVEAWHIIRDLIDFEDIADIGDFCGISIEEEPQ